MKRSVTYMVVFALSFAVASCGYRMSGTGVRVPQGVQSIAVLAFINKTNEPYVDVEVTRAVVNEFIADGRLQVKDVEAAELALRGAISRFEVIALSYSPQTIVQQYKVRLVVDAQLEDLRVNTVLWQEKGIETVFVADYSVAVGDVQVTKIAKDAAIKRASQDLAWTLRSRILEGF